VPPIAARSCLSCRRPFSVWRLGDELAHPIIRGRIPRGSRSIVHTGAYQYGTAAQVGPGSPPIPEAVFPPWGTAASQRISRPTRSKWRQNCCERSCWRSRSRGPFGVLDPMNVLGESRLIMAVRPVERLCLRVAGDDAG